jgi:hypothetical protein
LRTTPITPVIDQKVSIIQMTIYRHWWFHGLLSRVWR